MDTSSLRPEPTALEWCRAARRVAAEVPFYAVAAALGIELRALRERVANDDELAGLVRVYEAERARPAAERLGRVHGFLLDELSHALETGSAEKLGWMMREARLGHKVTGGAGVSTVVDRVDPGAPDREGTAKLLFLAGLCDLDYEAYCAYPDNPYPPRQPPVGPARVRWERAQAAMRGEAVPAATAEELSGEPPNEPLTLPPELRAPPAGGPARRREERQAALAALRLRLRDLIAGPTPATPEAQDLAEAVLALRWPHWPAYRGAQDLDLVDQALAALPPLDTATLRRLGARPTVTP